MAAASERARGGDSSRSLFEDANRQLVICNACRYCEGYCPVFRAIETRRTFNADDVLYMANLCHDCRACYYACMYAPPHEFAINIPAAMSRARTRTYEQYAVPHAFALAVRAPVAGAVLGAARVRDQYPETDGGSANGQLSKMELAGSAGEFLRAAACRRLARNRDGGDCHPRRPSAHTSHRPFFAALGRRCFLSSNSLPRYGDSRAGSCCLWLGRRR